MNNFLTFNRADSTELPFNSTRVSNFNWGVNEAKFANVNPQELQASPILNLDDNRLPFGSFDCQDSRHMM